MASQFPTQSPFYRSTPLVVDTHHAARQPFEDDEKNGLLEDSSIEQNSIESGLELSPPITTSRRESFAVGSTLLSPKTEDWPPMDIQSVPSYSFTDQNSESAGTRHTPFMRFPQRMSPWDLGISSGAQTTIQTLDHVQGAFDAHNGSAPSVFQRPMQNHNPFAKTCNDISSFNGGDQSTPASPQKEWMTSAQSLNRNLQRGNSLLRSHNELRRGDGIRKKNARFEIPPDRNLNNIDTLISQTNDEQELKELKSQKRLLRNRQAALDSRQRKKQHTERLEDEKKQYTSLISELEEDLAAEKEKMAISGQEKNNLLSIIDRMAMERDEMIRAHTLENGELRKKSRVLTEHIQRLESERMVTSANGVSGNFPDHYGGVDGMAMTMPGAWDSRSNFLNDFAGQQQHQQQQQHVRQQAALFSAKKSENNASEADKVSSQGGLLFMLFLVGALVMSSRSTPSLPRFPEDVRAASATILDSVLKDAGVNPRTTSAQANLPQPSEDSWIHQSTLAPSCMNDMNMDGNTPSILEELGNSLTLPTREQLNADIFSLSAAQYDGVSKHDFQQVETEKPTSQGRRSLAEFIAATRVANKRDGAAEVYTRSLLWDQIPNEVVRDFAKMVAECNNAQTEQQSNDSQ